MKIKASLTALALTAALAAPMASAEMVDGKWMFSDTEVQLQTGGTMDDFGGETKNTVTTFQHASNWKYGDNFFFIDQTTARPTSDSNAAGGKNFYAEWYSNFSLGAITGADLSFGPVKDIGAVIGVNYNPDLNATYALPGITFALDLPGFAFATLNTSAVILASDAGNAGGVTDEDTRFMVDFAWAYPFKIGSTSWSIEGHLEYMTSTDQTAFGNTGPVEAHILFQPQVRLDVGELIGTPSNRLFAGIEYQYWSNKYGTDFLEDNTVQFLAVWRF